MVRKFLTPLFFVFSLQLLFADLAFAGFGITPPYVRNTSLTRNSTYEQQIIMVRSDPNTDLRAEITLDAPDIEGWIEIVEGSVIQLPKGSQKVPMTVRVRVPSDADFTEYEGVIRIKTSKADDSVSAGAVSISLGAQVDIKLNIIDKEIKDFRVRKIGIEDLNEGHKLSWLYFPGKIDFKILLENTGNVSVAPSKVVFRVFDSSGTVLLEETEHTNRIKKVDPYGTDEVLAELPTRLPAGSYLARYQIYNDDKIEQEGELTLSVLPYGTLQTAGYGFFGLSLPHKISVLLPLLTISIIAGSLIYTQRRRKRETSDIS
jgi:hypothetical protein